MGAPLPHQVRKTSRQTVRWSVSPTPLPNSPGVAVSVDYFGPLPITARGNSYILLFTDRFSRRADMFAVTTAEAEGTANILVNHFIPLWGCPSTLLSDNGPPFCARLATAIYKLLGIHKLTTSAYHPSGNGGVERVNHTMAQMLAMVCNEHHRMPITTPLAPPRASPPMKSILDACRASLSPSLIDHTVVYIRTSIATNSPTATLLASANNIRTNLYENNTPSPSLG